MFICHPCRGLELFVVLYPVADATGYEHNGPSGPENEKFFMSFIVKILVNPANLVTI
jgi:hypothetical protein